MNTRRHWLTTACWMTAVVLLVGNAAAEIITPGDFAKSVKINFSGYAGTRPLANFPALIKLTDGAYGIRYSDMESGDYSDLRFTDSTGTNAIPFEVEQWKTTVPSAVNPGSLSGCLLWLKADAGIQTNDVGGVTNWVDQSANAYSAVSMAASAHPVYVANAINGQPVVRFSGANDNYIKFPQLTTIRTVLWVIKEDADASASSPRFLLGDNTGNIYQFHRGASKTIWDGAHAPLMFNGLTELNGALIDGRSTLMPTTMSVLSVRTSGNATANTLSNDRNIGGRTWDGDLAEVIIYNRVLTGSEMTAIYLYLENKYAIDVAVDASPSLNASIWVQVPELTNNAAIFAYCGNPAATEIPAYTTNGTVWANAYAGVWHLSDTNDVITDSTVSALNGTNNGTVSTNGISGMARDWPGANFITLSASSLASISSQATVSFWQRGGTVSQCTIFGANNASGNRILQSHLPWSGRIYWDAGGPSYNRIDLAAAESLYKGEWSHWAFTKNTTDGTMRIYRNGVQWHSGTGTTASMAGATAFKLGSSASGAETYRGTIDEFSVSSVERSADWIKAAYNSQATPNLFAVAELDYYYDTSTSEGLQAGNRLWSTDSTSWSTTAAGSDTLEKWVSGACAHFEASGTSSVTVESVQARKLIFNGSGYTLTSGSIDLSQGIEANESATIKTPIKLTAPQEWYVAEGKTLTLDGAGWNIAYTLTKTGKGILRFINHNYSNCGADLDIIIKEGEVRFETAYWWSYDTTDALRIQVMSGASLYTANTPFGFLQWPSDGSLEQVILEENATWNMASNIGIPGGLYGSSGRIVLKGANLLGGSIHPMNASTVETKASDIQSRITSSFNGHVADAGWQMIVANGAAEPDLRMEGSIGANVTGIAKNGLGTAELRAANAQQATTINAGTLLVNNTTGSGTGTGPVTINGGTLSGTGMVANVVSFGANGGTIVPGPTTGALTVKSNVTFTASGSATNRFTVTLNSGTDYTRLYVADGGTVTLGNATLNVTLNAQLFTERLFVIVNDGTDPVVGTFKDLPEGAVLKLGRNEDSYTIHYAANAETGELSGGNDVALVPIPKGTIILLR